MTSIAAQQFLRAYTLAQPQGQPRTGDHDARHSGVQLADGAADAFIRLDPSAAAVVLSSVDAATRVVLGALVAPAAQDEDPTPKRGPGPSNVAANAFLENAPARVDVREALGALRAFELTRSPESAIRLAKADPSRLASVSQEAREDLRAELVSVLLDDLTHGKKVSREAEDAAAALLAGAPDAAAVLIVIRTALAGETDVPSILEHIASPELALDVRKAAGMARFFTLPSFDSGREEEDGPYQAIRRELGASFFSTHDSPAGAVDWNWIAGHEGGSRLDGYVPHIGRGGVSKHSGVTVATGVDLGGKSRAELRRLGVDEALIKKLEPYLGLRGQRAASAIAHHKLHLTPTEAQHLDQRFRAGTERDTARLFDAAVNDLRARGVTGLKNFADLPPNIRTAIVSLTYHAGMPAGPKNGIVSSGLWDALTRQDWKKSATILDTASFYRPFKARRRDTIALLGQGSQPPG